MATSSTRALWKGAISFGLVHVPVSLHSAVEDSRPKFNMLDARTMNRVGNQSVNKATGEAMPQAEIVKGMEVEPGSGQYVVLTKEEIRAALPRTMQTIEIEAFVKLADIPIQFFSKPYYVSPINKGQKVYALLREVLKRTGRAGIGKVVVSTKQHLAVVAPQGGGLVVNLLRWNEEVRDMAGLQIPGDAASAGVTDRELKMGEQLVMDLADDWHPENYHDEFKEQLAELVRQKAKAGEVRTVVDPEGGEVAKSSADVIDLTELLRKSLRGAAAPAPARSATAARRTAANDETSAKKAAAAVKTPARARASVKPKRKSA